MYTFKAHGLMGYCIVRLVIFFALKVNIYLQIMSIKHLDRLDSTKNVYFHCILCAASLPASLIMHVPISQFPNNIHNGTVYIYELLQFHPTFMLVAYANSCFIINSPKLLSCFFF